MGEPLLQRCQRRDEPLAVLVFDFDDLADVQDLYGIQARREMLGLIGRHLRRLAGSKGLALRVAQSRFVVLLPGCSGSRALERAAATLGVPCSFVLDSDQHELVLVPRLTALCATAETDSLAQMLRNAQPRPAAPDRRRQCLARGAKARADADLDPDAGGAARRKAEVRPARPPAPDDLPRVPRDFPDAAVECCRAFEPIGSRRVQAARLRARACHF